ncbi:uncharacterized protein BO97DRAFT_334645, partial [Aspergillus homomorphus CBS 101889]
QSLPKMPEPQNQEPPPSTTPFRFKSTSTSKTRNKDKATRHATHRARRQNRTHSRTRTRTRSPTPVITPGRQRQLTPETAFRESLFDALGDDEGATYWESVYGQPIHTYAIPSIPKGPAGELEQMDEEEYAAYVRGRMWERTREGMVSERERLRAERQQAQARDRDRARARETERDAFDRAVEESLRRGRERKRLRGWRVVWAEYLECWGRLDGLVEGLRLSAHGDGDQDGERAKHSFRNIIFWPVESGKRRDVSKGNVEEFMRRCCPDTIPTDTTTHKSGQAELLALLKAERIRWHPDKIQQRYGVLGIEESVLRSVTEVFQIIDQMWNDLRAKEPS